MTSARKKALQWFHDRGEVSPLSFWPNGKIGRKDRPSNRMISLMYNDDQLCWKSLNLDGVYTLTDKGRRALKGETK